MKKNLLHFKELQILRRNEKLMPNCCYLLNSESVARNLYFESKTDVLRAHNFFTKHLSPIMEIIEYLFTPHGWLLAIIVKSEKEILSNIDRKLYTSKTMRSAIRNKKYSIIISECIRYAISGIAGKTNQRKKRKGTLVSRNFSRFIFKDFSAAKIVMDKMRKQQIHLCWQGKRFKPSLKVENEATELLKNGDVFLCTKKREKIVFMGGLVNDCLKLIDNKIDVLRKIIEATFEIYFPNPHPPNLTQLALLPPFS